MDYRGRKLQFTATPTCRCGLRMKFMHRVNRWVLFFICSGTSCSETEYVEGGAC